MVFSSLVFIFVFLPLVMGVYFLTLRKFSGRPKIFTFLNFVLLVASVVFYLEGEKKYFWVMLVIGLTDYIIALLIENNKNGPSPSPPKQKALLLISIVSNMGLLFYFKYFDFAASALSDLTGGRFGHSVISLTLPIGISFYTFESMSYIIDVYRNHVKATRRFIDYWTFITFFPHLVAGPIIRYADLKSQLENRNHSWDNIYEGFRRFALGLGKKVIIANPLGYYADIFFVLDYTRIDTGLAWVAALTYTLQIYFDFSGYSDMAIGLAKIFGVSLPENFNYPYVSKSIKEFWRRWHMTLSNWFRDYLYIPLGGNRDGVVKEYRNLIIVFALCGLWHGASVNFLLWGCFHGLFLVAERIAGKVTKWTPPVFVQHCYALVVIVFSWVIFRSESFDQIKFFSKSLLGLNGPLISDQTIEFVTRPHFIVYFVLGVIFSVPLSTYSQKVAEINKRWQTESSWGMLAPLLILIFSAIVLCGQEYNPFIYFRF